MANVTYKHLEGKTVIGQFTLGQWAQLLAGVALGLLFGIYLSPLPPMPTVFIACLLPGLPLAASYGAMGLEFSLAQGLRAGWRHWRRPRRYLPGPGPATTGYHVEPDEAHGPADAGPAAPTPGARSGGAMGRLSARRQTAMSCPRRASCWPSRRWTPRGLVTSEGALVRYLRVAPKNPLVMSDSERGQVSHAFGQLVSRAPAGQSLQFYVDAAPVRLDALLEHSRAEADRALAPLEASAEAGLRQRAEVLRRLHGAVEQSLELHCDEQAAVELGYYVVVPYVPDQGLRVDWRSLIPGRRRRLPTAPLSRALESHRRVVRESLRLTDSIRADLEALGSVHPDAVGPRGGRPAVAAL